jgi:hypothetical protein
MVHVSKSVMRHRVLHRLLSEHDHRCAACGVDLMAAVVPSFVRGQDRAVLLFDIDHVRPVYEVQKTYFTSTENAQPLCLVCHHSKTQRDMVGRRRGQKRPRAIARASGECENVTSSESAGEDAESE